MKNRFSTIDIRSAIVELREKFLSLRVASVYDIDHKTYLIKLSKPDFKAMILIESGNRIHSTEFEWPKSMMPSGFSMKLRKHLKTRRLEKVEQLGIDRIVDLQFGSQEAAYHVILELYDRGNIILTDHEYTILNILRPRTDECQDVKYAVREIYPVSVARQPEPLISLDRLQEILSTGKSGDHLRKILNPHLVYGPAVLDHCLLTVGFPDNVRLDKGFTLTQDIPKLMLALEMAESILQDTGHKICKGYIIQSKEKKVTTKSGEADELMTYKEFHPFLYKQHEKEAYIEFESFNKAVDEFFSQLETQKLDMKALQQEKVAVKKLENVRKDHEVRLDNLKRDQEHDKKKAQLIEMNLHLVDRAISIVQSAIANQIDWTEISEIVKEAQLQGDPVAMAIKTLKLDTNHIIMMLRDPNYSDDDEYDEGESRSELSKPVKVEIDLGCTGYANARKYYDMKRSASVKEQKTVDSSAKALKNAEKKTKQTLKEVAVVTSINKARKTYWFEKFLWFISSENYLVIGGRDQQQNEIIVKKYMRPGDVYVHADLHGASSVIVKNSNPGDPIPPKTLNEAGTMAVCNSAAWEAKVVTSAWWVYPEQVTKTAPTGEYLTTGSFMIRGKKNYLPPCYLIYGFGVLFKVDEEDVFRHKGERKVRTVEEDTLSVTTETESEATEQTVDISDDSDSDSESEDKPAEDVIEDIKNVKISEPEETEPAKSERRDATGPSKSEGQKETGPSKSEGLKETGQMKSEKQDVEFPDTNITLKHVKGDKYELSLRSEETKDDYDNKEFYLGDDKPVTLGNKSQTTGRLSAKQRREMKRNKKRGVQTENVEETDDKPEEVPRSEELVLEQSKSEEQEQTKSDVEEDDTEQDEEKRAAPQQQQAPPKRGQKAKLKKMKEKYKDQDDEDRKLMMELLASAGNAKEKKGKKGKKAKQELKGQQKVAQQQKGRPQPGKGKPPGSQPFLPRNHDVIMSDDMPQGVKGEEGEGHVSDDDKVDEAVLPSEEIDLLDSMTGIPVPEDTLMYAIPVMAPYNAILNYKYKVKLIPGTTKRGKAAKTAINMFQHDKSGTIREKDLFKTVKDNDLSRNMPGKVKVSAPNLHRKGHKK